MGAKVNLTTLEDQETTSTVGPALIEILSPAARQRSHRRGALTALACLFLATVTAFIAINVKDFDTSPTVITSTHARSVAALAPECTLANDITLTESNQAKMSTRWWNITFINHGDSACSLRGDPVPQFVQGATRNPLGPPNQQIVTSAAQTMWLGLTGRRGTAIVAATSTEPFMMGSRCGADLGETAMNLTFRKSTFFVKIPDVTTASDIQNVGVCSKFPNLGYAYDVSV